MTVATTSVVRIQRTIAATPQRIFDAWLNPKALAKFMGIMPDYSCDVVNDPRVGGRFFITMVGDDPQPHTGEYLVIDRPRKLVFTWCSKGTSLAETTVTIELRPAKGGATELTLTHVGLAKKAASGHEQGWTMIVDGIAKALKR